ncbi:MAG: hypothetical protein V8T36_12615 [Ruthenibacterium lactatiformans]
MLVGAVHDDTDLTNGKDLYVFSDKEKKKFNKNLVFSVIKICHRPKRVILDGEAFPFPLLVMGFFAKEQKGNDNLKAGVFPSTHCAAKWRFQGEMYRPSSPHSVLLPVLFLWQGF